MQAGDGFQEWCWGWAVGAVTRRGRGTLSDRQWCGGQLCLPQLAGVKGK